MAVVFSADWYPPHERKAALAAAFSASTSPVSVTFDRVLAGDCMEAWQLGANGSVLRIRHAGEELSRRTERQVRMGNPETVSFGLSLQGSCLSTNHNHQVVRNGEIRLIDLTSPYEKRHTGGSACSFEIPYTALGVSVDVARAALPHVAASPLHALAVSHLQMLPRVLDLPGSGRAAYAGREYRPAHEGPRHLVYGQRLHPAPGPE